MYRDYPLRNSALDQILTDEEQLQFKPCPHCQGGYLRALAEGGYRCANCESEFKNQMFPDVSEIERARDMLHSAQELFTFYVHQIQNAKKLCKKAGRIYRNELKKQDNLQLKKELADLYALLAHTYVREELYYDEIKADFPKARDNARKQVELREEIAEKENSLLNTFLLGAAWFDLGVILDNIQRSNGQKEREKGTKLVETAVRAAKEAQDMELFHEMEKRLIFQLHHQILMRYDYWAKPATFKELIPELENYQVHAESVLERNDFKDYFVLQRMFDIFKLAKKVFEKAGQPEEGISYLWQSIQLETQIIKKEIEDIEYWEKGNFYWEETHWKHLFSIQKLYMDLFELYFDLGQEESARRVLAEMSAFLKSDFLLGLVKKIHVGENYFITAVRTDLAIAKSYEKLNDNEEALVHYENAIRNLDFLEKYQHAFEIFLDDYCDVYRSFAVLNQKMGKKDAYQAAMEQLEKYENLRESRAEKEDDFDWEE